MDQAIQLYSPPTLHISNCVTVQLTEKNYLLWKTQFESFLSGQNLLGFVNGAFPQPLASIPVPAIDGQVSHVTNPDFLAWHRADQVVRAWLLGSLSEDILRYVVHTITSRDLWSALAQHFNKVSASRLFELQHKLQTVEKLDKSMDEYLKEIKRVCEQLASIGSPVSEQMKIFAALKGLGREYEPMKTSVEGSMDAQPSLTLDAVISRLTSYSDRLASYHSGSEVSPHMAFNTITASSGYYSSNRGRGNSRYGNNRGRNNFTTKGRGFHQQISQEPGGTNKVICQICGKPGHPASKCWHRFDNSYQFDNVPQVLAALRVTDVTDHNGNEWVLDFGATTHVTNSPHHLQQAQVYEGNESVMMGDGSFLPITHTGLY
ncbi:PREDICTED: uncharacterized protein LOC104734030 [Camelina sativa]|uniref:Uncharacterized protein LOC104734030 n=1 Tax=Camelina sativa TaxID=90675 RepID=A0ABM0V6W0_CAMSA|nr:PREDICTED: uncharacterized protein LOC104734030 [Camelina sativa]